MTLYRPMKKVSRTITAAGRPHSIGLRKPATSMVCLETKRPPKHRTIQRTLKFRAAGEGFEEGKFWYSRLAA